MAGVKRHKARELEALTQRIASLDARSIDSLYGLEPVYEPGSGQPAGALASVSPEEFVPVQCPYCGERLETRVDLTATDPTYIEDCEVCCRPIEFTVERADAPDTSADRISDEPWPGHNPGERGGQPGGALIAVKVQRVD